MASSFHGNEKLHQQATVETMISRKYDTRYMSWLIDITKPIKSTAIKPTTRPSYTHQPHRGMRLFWQDNTHQSQPYEAPVPKRQDTTGYRHRQQVEPCEAPVAQPRQRIDYYKASKAYLGRHSQPHEATTARHKGSTGHCQRPREFSKNPPCTPSSQKGEAGISSVPETKKPANSSYKPEKASKNQSYTPPIQKKKPMVAPVMFKSGNEYELSDNDREWMKESNLWGW